MFIIDPGPAGEFYRSHGIGTYLKERGIKTVDGVVISHPHGDHFGAGIELFRDFKVLELIDAGFNPKNNASGGYNAAFWKAFQRSGAKHVTGLRSGDSLVWDPELTVKILGPRNPFWTFAEAGNDPERHYNQNSLVVWVKHGQFSHLFTGDITAPAQNYLRLNWPAEVKDTAVLAVPHHGKYYYHEAFAKMVGSNHPSVRLAIVSASHTRKGPAADRAPAWREAGLNLYTGANKNAVTIRSDGKALALETTNPPTKRKYQPDRRGTRTAPDSILPQQ